ncbi:MAG: hypothetical protein WDW38_009201 [Sanguina aurantia]
MRAGVGNLAGTLHARVQELEKQQSPAAASGGGGSSSPANVDRRSLSSNSDTVTDGVRVRVTRWYSLQGRARLKFRALVHVYDLAENKIMPLCCQKIVKKARLTKLAFNPRQPILLIGDDKGTVTSMKLSPNLRQASKPEKGQKFEDLETAKLDKVIEVARKTAAH